MTIPAQPQRGGFRRPVRLGVFIRQYLAGEISAPVVDPRTYFVTEDQVLDPGRGAVITDIRRRYQDTLALARARAAQARAVDKGNPPREDSYWLVRHKPRGQGISAASFYSYVSALRRLGWVELTGEAEPSAMGGEPNGAVERLNGSARVLVPQPRRYVRLTGDGLAASLLDWQDPIRALYGGAEQPAAPPRAPERRALLPALASIRVAQRFSRPAVLRVLNQLLLMAREGAYTPESVEAEKENLMEGLQQWVDTENDREEPNEDRTSSLEDALVNLEDESYEDAATSLEELL